MPPAESEGEAVPSTAADIHMDHMDCSSTAFMLSMLVPATPPSARSLYPLNDFSDFEQRLERDKNATVVRKQPSGPGPDQASKTKEVPPSKESHTESADALKVQPKPDPGAGDLDSRKGWLQFDFDEKEDKLLPDIPPNTTVIIETSASGDRFITFENADQSIDPAAAAAVSGSTDGGGQGPEFPFADGKQYPLYAFNRKYRYDYKDGGLVVARQPEHFYHYEFAEHMKLGNDLQLRMSETQTQPATQYVFKLKNKVELTYGQINGLAGDFYGTDTPISNGAGDQKQRDLFLAAFNTLAGADADVSEEVKTLLKNRQDEVKALKDEVDRPRKPNDPNTGPETGKVYQKLDADSKKITSWGITLPEFAPVDDISLYIATRSRKVTPNYLALSLINFDHFGADARKAYNAGHYCAMKEAAGGDLLLGYTMNAFADHFLGDSFASGHMRTPRRLLHSGGGKMGTAAIEMFPDWCAQMMHAEDNANGLLVSNGSDTWTAYGDKYLFERKNEVNRKRMLSALQASIDEVWDSHAKQKIAVDNPAAYGAWKWAPDLTRLKDTIAPFPLFKADPPPAAGKDNDISSSYLLMRNDWNKVDVGKYTKFTSWGSLALHMTETKFLESDVVKKLKDAGKWLTSWFTTKT